MMSRVVDECRVVVVGICHHSLFDLIAVLVVFIVIQREQRLGLDVARVVGAAGRGDESDGERLDNKKQRRQHDEQSWHTIEKLRLREEAASFKAPHQQSSNAI